MLSQTELRGTARFMSMGGAFTALGGDLSTLTQNPAGIGVYRRSEIGATLDISPRKITSETNSTKESMSKTKVYCNNFGYVGTARLDGIMGRKLQPRGFVRPSLFGLYSPRQRFAVKLYSLIYRRS